MCSRLDLPAPDGATSATASPGYSAEIGPAQDVERGIALLVAAVDGFEAQDFHAAHSYRSASTGSSREARHAG